MGKYISYEKVASTDQNGNIWLSDEFTNEIIDGIKQTCGEEPLFKALISIAERECDEHKALKLFETVLRKTAFRVGKEDNLFPFAEKALQGLGKLCSSEDEYIWEVSSQLYGDFREILLEQKKMESDCRI